MRGGARAQFFLHVISIERLHGNGGSHLHSVKFLLCVFLVGVFHLSVSSDLYVRLVITSILELILR